MRRVLYRWAGAEAKIYTINAHRFGDVLEFPSAKILVVNVDLALDLPMGVLRKKDAARSGEGLEAGGDVHAVAVDVLALDDHVAEVDADAEADALPVGNVRLPPGHALLDRDRARDAVDDRGELAQHAVADELDDPPAVLG